MSERTVLGLALFVGYTWGLFSDGNPWNILWFGLGLLMTLSIMSYLDRRAS